MSLAKYKARTIAIAKGTYTPNKDEPKVWFESIKSMAQILSNDNQDLLQVILDNKPQSLKELEELTGRAKSNLSRTLKTLERYGIVELNKVNNALVPQVKATQFSIEFGLSAQSQAKRKLTTFDISQYLDSKEMAAEYLSQVLKDGDMNELLKAIGNIAKAKGMTQVSSKHNNSLQKQV